MRVYLVLALVSFGFALFGAIYTALWVYRSWRRTHWPSTKGLIATSEVSVIR